MKLLPARLLTSETPENRLDADHCWDFSQSMIERFAEAWQIPALAAGW
jgi:hypothetical protein